MRKTILLIAAVFILLAPLAAQNIHVLKPNGGEMLMPKDAQGNPRTFLIQWAAKNINQKVKIVLLNADGSKFGLIKGNRDVFPAEYLWPIGQTESGPAPAGKYYKIRVATMDNSCEDVSDAPFVIQVPPPPLGPGNVFKKKLSVNVNPGITTPVPLKPDLIVCKILPHILDKSLYLQKLQFRVHNIGKGPSPACSVWIDCPQVLGPQSVKPLAPGEFEEFTNENAKIYWAGADIPYTFHVDKDGLVAESDENNNVLTGVLSASTSESAKCSDGKSHSIFKVTKKW